MAPGIDKILKTADHSARSVKDAEFSSKKWVWLPDDTKAFIKGFVTAEDDGDLTVRCEDGSVGMLNSICWYLLTI